MSVFKNVADIQTADMLKLPVPEAHYHNIALKPSEYQKEIVASLAERAEKVRNREVDSSVDNMLLITNDGRKLALDQRLINPMLPSDPNSKAAKCAENVFEIWQRTAGQRSTQMIFCDLSTPKDDGTFSVYDDIHAKLLELGIPENEIAFIHNAKSEVQKKDLFGKVRSGQVRILLGSTQRMGAGTNCQQKAHRLAPSGLSVASVRPSAAGGAHHPAGQRKPGGRHLQLCHRGHLRCLFVPAGRSQAEIYIANYDQQIACPLRRRCRRTGAFLCRDQGAGQRQPHD